MESDGPLQEGYSARIKNLLIELNDYAYFHSPSEVDNLDRRFTGRKEVLERLKSLFTDYEAPSGAYLVTGYRGAGKSSLVARALADVSIRLFRGKRGSRYLRLMVPLIPLSILGNLFTSTPVLVCSVVAWFLLLVYTCWTDPDYPNLLEGKKDLDNYFSHTFDVMVRILTLGMVPRLGATPLGAWESTLKKSFRLSLGRSFILGEETFPRERFRVFAQDLLLLLTLHFSALIVFETFGIDSFLRRFFIYLAILSAYLLFNTAVGTYLSGQDSTSSSQEAFNKSLKWIPEGPRLLLQSYLFWFFVLPLVLFLFYRFDFSLFSALSISLFLFLLFLITRSWGQQIFFGFWKRLKDYFRYSNRVCIKINLSQDDIKELDILRLIARNLYLNYRDFANSWRYDVHWRGVRFLVLFLFVALLYGADISYQINSSLKRSFHISCYFPSQGDFLLVGGAQTYFDVLDAQQPLDAASFRKALEDEVNTSYRALGSAGLAGSGAGAPIRKHLIDHRSRPGSLGRLQSLAMNVTTYLDVFVQAQYRGFIRALPEDLRSRRVDPIFSAKGLYERLVILPKRIDYLFIFYFGLAWSLGLLVFRSPFFGLVSHQLILRRLQELNEMIETQVTHEKGMAPLPASTLFSLSFGKRQRLTSLTLNERDIEKYLLEILGLIERIPRLTARPEFIFVFDELDKIQHLGNQALADKELESDGFQNREFSSLEAERERQHKILALVSNLKHFLTTAPAKFVFIAGREMFDAALADVSDRHYFMGSVFNEVLHVPSFHTDNTDDRLPDITSLTEEYLCRFLLPRSWRSFDLSLRTYKDYLSKELLPGDCPLQRKQREKVLYELQHFITYLTYRSNGAPKKITEFIERYLVRPDSRLFFHPDTLFVGKSSRSFYLHFKYDDQYTFGLITYLGSPLILSLNRSIKDYGDKILVSSSFLLDHIYKFHGHGFSWRNLELLPEIVDINRAPQLRELIRKIMNFLSKSDITEIASGLYDFKFTRRITEEIAFLSKVSEYESAAFNFTLDESLAIKRHFNRKLKELLKTYDKYPNSGGEKFVNSIAFLRMILGDLHFYDGELDSAIVEYMEAVQALREVDTKSIRIDTLVLMVRNFLKLGLAFERKRSYESALVTYGRIASLVAQVGEGSTQLRSQSQHPSERLFGQTAFEGIRLIYQPMFARLQLMEKSALGGITENDINYLIQDFQRTLTRRQVEQRFLLKIEFKNKVADILYFKNGPAVEAKDAQCGSRKALFLENQGRKKLIAKGRRLPCSACRFYHEALELLSTRYLGIKKPKRQSLLVEILRSFEGGKLTPDRSSTIKELGGTLSSLGNVFLSCSSRYSLDKDLLASILVLADEDDHMGLHSEEPLSERLETALAGRTMNKVEEALVFFLVAAWLFRWTPDSRSCSRELTKILWVIREVLAVKPKDHGLNSTLERALTSLAEAAIQESYRSHEGTHRIEIEKIKEILEKRDEPGAFVDRVNLGRLSINASITEIAVIYDEIRLSLENPDTLEIDRRTSPYAMVQSVFSRIHALRYRTRVNFQNFKYIILDEGSDISLQDFVDRHQMTDGELAKASNKLRKIIAERCEVVKHRFPEADAKTLNDEPVLEFLITDSIYCHHEIIRTLEIYSNSYMASHSMRASAHRNLAAWCDYYYSYLRYKRGLEVGQGMSDAGSETVRRIEERLRQLVGPAELVTLGPNYHREKALSHFKAARETHSEGKAYNELIGQMYYLSDDFADQLEQFCAGLERLRINSEDIDNAIRGLHQKLAKTVIHEPGQYAGGGAFFSPAGKSNSAGDSNPGPAEKEASISPLPASST